VLLCRAKIRYYYGLPKKGCARFLKKNFCVIVFQGNCNGFAELCVLNSKVQRAELLKVPKLGTFGCAGQCSNPLHFAVWGKL
jgi:hypothetical protein